MFLFFFLANFFQVAFTQDVGLAQSEKSLNFVYDLSNFRKENEVRNLLNIDDLLAESVFVREFEGRILYEKNPNKQKDIASLTKLLSAYLGYILYSPKDSFVFDPESVNQFGEVGNFKVGEKISRDDILKASLIASSNDAIYLLAKIYGKDKFVSLMNQKAMEFGMTKSIFFDPTGLDRNISTAEEVFKLLEGIYSRTPELFSLTLLEKININGKNLWTTNLLLPKYKSIIVGGKTGYKEEVKGHLALILKFNQSPFIGVVILSSSDRFGDAEKIIKALKDYYGD
jgi:D-alanyl-D-alanine carboxypeptidase